ncbi:MAG: hypothetical protein ACRDC8_19060, partial [Aeromonas veronii]
FTFKNNILNFMPAKSPELFQSPEYHLNHHNQPQIRGRSDKAAKSGKSDDAGQPPHRGMQPA